MMLENSTNKLIRILHMIGSFEVGGSQAMVINLYKSIDRTKIQFDFIVDHPNRMELANVVKKLGAKIYEMPSFTGKNYFQVCKAWNKFFVEHPEYKVLHSHVRSYASVYIPIAKKHGLKTIIHSHSTSNGKGFKSVVKRIMQYPLRYQADYFFSCSEEAGRWLFGDKVISSDKHIVLKNSIDAGRYRFNEKTRAEYRQNLGLGEKKVYIHVGRFHVSKNHEFLLYVFRKIRDIQTDAILVLIGDGELRSEIEQLILKLELQNDIILLGNRQDVPELLQAADLFLFPSSWEGLGIVAVEAQAAGLPCICSDQVPLLAKVTDECLFIPLDEEEWVKTALDCSLKRNDNYQSIVTLGYDIKESARKMMEFYDLIW